MNWTPERVAEALRTRGTSPSHAHAAALLSARWGESVSAKALERIIAKRRAALHAAVDGLPEFAEEKYGETEPASVDVDLSDLAPPPHVAADRSEDTAPAIPVAVHRTRRDHGALERVLLVPDCHIPYEDPEAFAVMMAAARELRPDTIVILGDFADFLSVSSHDRRPKELGLQLRDEVEAVKMRLAELDSLGATRKVYCSGNHERRAERMAARNAPAFADLVRVEDLFGLAARGWEWHPYRQHATIGKLHVVHDTGDAGPYAHARSGAAFESSVVIGHTHRLATSYFGSARGERHVAAMLGWLGSAEAASYMAPIKVTRTWQHGFGVSYVEPDGVAHLQAVPIIGGRCVLEGRVVAPDLAHIRAA
jgi:predicted phosphodiesterase